MASEEFERSTRPTQPVPDIYEHAVSDEMRALLDIDAPYVRELRHMEARRLQYLTAKDDDHTPRTLIGFFWNEAKLAYTNRRIETYTAITEMIFERMIEQETIDAFHDELIDY